MRLVVEGAGSPELPLRVLNLFVQNGITVERAVLDLERDGYRLVLDTGPVAPQRCALIVENIRAMVLVRAVTMLELEAV